VLGEDQPDIVVLCPAASKHGEWVEKVAPFGVHIIMEKPFAGSLSEADAMAAAMKPTGKLLTVNWPLVWFAGQQTAHRLIQEGVIGEVLEFHHDGGNRGPLYHGADKIDKEPTAAEKAASWFYSKALGGSLRDYMGYGTSTRHLAPGQSQATGSHLHLGHPEGIEVDEHAVAVIRYATGLSKTEPAGAPSPIPGLTNRSRTAASSSRAPTAPSPSRTTPRNCVCKPAPSPKASWCQWTKCVPRTATPSSMSFITWRQAHR